MNKFVSIEGIDGSGKTTLVKNLCAYLEKNNIEFITFREPGGNPIGEQIRNLLISDNNMDSYTEALLFAAARNENVKKVIQPAINAGKIIIADRFTDSTLAYQGYGRGIDINYLKQLNDMATSEIYPNLTIILDLDIDTALLRVNKGFVDRFEKESIDFHKKVRNGYLRIAAESKSNRYYILDANCSQDLLLCQAIQLLFQNGIIPNRI